MTVNETDDKPEWWRPPSGLPQRAPFSEHNGLALKSGHRSPRVYGHLAEMLAAGLVADRPDLAAYPEAVAAWATAEAQTALMRRNLDQQGTFGPDGEPRSGMLKWLHQYERAAAKYRAALGLDPRSEAALAKERAAAAGLAVDLHALAERGREALAHRTKEPPDLAGEVLEMVKRDATDLWEDAKQKFAAHLAEHDDDEGRET